MSVFTQVTVTKIGKSLLSSVGVGNTLLTFSSIKTSSTVYDPDEIESLESIDVEQSVNISGKSIVNSTNVKLHTVLSNSSLDTGYYVRTVGIYAMNGEIEILYGVIQETSGNCYMPQSSLTNTAFDFSIVLTVSNTKNVSVITAPDGVPSIAQFQELKNTVNEIINNSIRRKISIETIDWSNKEYMYEIKNVTKEDLASIWFADDSIEIAEDAEIKVYTVNSGLRFTCENVPLETINCTAEVKIV